MDEAYGMWKTPTVKNGASKFWDKWGETDLGDFIRRAGEEAGRDRQGRSNCDETEIFLNGKLLGRKKRFGEPVVIPVGRNESQDLKVTSKYRLMWQVPYQPGTLRVVGYKGGKQAAAKEVRTAPALRPESFWRRTEPASAPTVTTCRSSRCVSKDKDGNFCPLADNRKAFNGLALLTVRSQAGQAGRIQIAAASDGLQPAQTVVTTTAH